MAKPSRRSPKSTHWHCTQVRRTGAGLVALALVVTAADACELPPGGQPVANGDGSVRLAYRFEPTELRTDRHFALLVDVCAAAPVEAVRVDAQMPEHRHGMNYKPVVAKSSADRWRADGLLLHMPGRWEFRFDVRTGNRTERLTHAVNVE